MKSIQSGRIVGKISSKNPTRHYSNPHQIEEQCVIANKNNLIYCEKDRELFLEDNNFITPLHI
jgi:hypothetical protein